MKKPVFSCSNVFDKRVTLHCHQYFENFLYMFYIQGVRKSLHILHRKVIGFFVLLWGFSVLLTVAL